MVLVAKTKIVQSRNARTQYIIIPADMVADSQYPFSGGGEVEIIVIPSEAKLEIRKVGAENFLGGDLKDPLKHGKTKKF
jgi:hypothetical protein